MDGEKSVQRDFEIFINGSLLIKPDMSHLETYPNFYKPMETFVPTRWDFEDLEDKILDLINDKKKRRDFVKWARKLSRHNIKRWNGKIL